MTPRLGPDELIRVLIVDDDASIRAALRLLLELEGDLEVVGEAGDGASAVAACEALTPHVVLMDVQMRGVDGLEATRMLTARAQPPAVLVLTTFDVPGRRAAAAAAGAAALLLKRAPVEQLVAAIRAVAR